MSLGSDSIFDEGVYGSDIEHSNTSQHIYAESMSVSAGNAISVGNDGVKITGILPGLTINPRGSDCYVNLGFYYGSAPFVRIT